MTGFPRAAGKPLISVILAVRQVAEYLPGCLDSILGQPDLPAGIEVIAVDDASPDGCGAILDTRAAADPRLRVIRLAEQAGPGPARMRGLAEATGRTYGSPTPTTCSPRGAWPRSRTGWSGTGPTSCSSTTASCGPPEAASRALGPRCWPALLVSSPSPTGPRCSPGR